MDAISKARHEADVAVVETGGPATNLKAIIRSMLTPPSLEELGVHPEILAAAEEIIDGSDVLGIERSRLEFLVRYVIALDRRSRPDAALVGEGV